MGKTDKRGIKVPAGEGDMTTANPVALLRRLLQETSEKPWLEFKVNNADPEMIGRTVSACANAAMLEEKHRAYIVWGIENKTKKKVGTTVRLSDLKKGAENLSNWLARLIEPRLEIEFLDFEQDGVSFAILGIDPSYDRPVRFSGTEYIRIGENVKPLKDYPNHERSLWFATSRRTFENAVALGHQKQSEVFDVLQYDQFYMLKNEKIPDNKDEIIRCFCQKGFIKDNMEGGYDILNLGALLFAKDLGSFPSLNSKSVRVIKYKGRDKSKTEDEVEGKKGYAVGFSGLLKYIIGKLPKTEEFDSGVRRSVSRYPEIAIREVVANALIHQDLTISGAGPLIEIYEDRLEVTNPGRSLIERDRIIDERRSRNEKLASAMRELGLCEERGSGVDKAIIEIENTKLPAPEFISSTNSMRVVIFGPRPFSKLSKQDRIWSCFCHCVVRWLQHDYMSNNSLRERFSLQDEEYQAASGVIAEARKAKRIVAADPDQGKRNAKYVPYWVRQEL